MRRNKPAPLGGLLRALLREDGLETPLNQYRLVESWREVMGPTISRYTGDVRISNSVLYVKVNNPALRQDLSMGKTNLVQKLNAHVGAQVITSIVFY